VNRSGHLDSKGELLSEVWPKTTVQEVNLTVTVSAIRKALEGSGAAMIETVSAHEY
jgi:DNA-binding winged helix-turn-helix (wHTH) protein